MGQSVIVYNPRSYNGKPTPAIDKFRWGGGKWDDLPSNSWKSYPENVAKELLDRYEFLKRVSPEELKNIEKKINSDPQICPHCGDDFDSKAGLKGHLLGKHKMSKDAEDVMKGIPEAKVDAKVVTDQAMTPEQAEGIPDTSKLKPGQFDDDWYGAGLQDDSPGDTKIVRPGDPGVFGA